MRVVLDTSVLIDHLRGRTPQATQVIERFLAEGAELWSSCIVRAEVRAGMRPAEEAATEALLGLIEWEAVGPSQADAAGALGRRYLAAHPGIEVPDLLVAELTQRLGAELLTRNIKHFPMLARLRAPY